MAWDGGNPERYVLRSHATKLGAIHTRSIEARGAIMHALVCSQHAYLHLPWPPRAEHVGGVHDAAQFLPHGLVPDAAPSAAAAVIAGSPGPSKGPGLLFWAVTVVENLLKRALATWKTKGPAFTSLVRSISKEHNKPTTSSSRRSDPVDNKQEGRRCTSLRHDMKTRTHTRMAARVEPQNERAIRDGTRLCTSCTDVGNGRVPVGFIALLCTPMSDLSCDENGGTVVVVNVGKVESIKPPAKGKHAFAPSIS